MEKLTDISKIRNLFEKHGFSFSKNLGQNFLINPSVCPKIAEFGNAKPGVGIIEIGTGVGVLTNELAKRAEKVVGIEIDSSLLPILADTLSEYNNVKIVNEDVMKVDLERLIADEFSGMEVAICANIPYYITSPIIMMLLERKLPLLSITVMVQKEAATRICAKLGTREVGAISVGVRYFATPVQLFNVSRGSFLPSPNVDSCVIRLDINKQKPKGITDEKFFFRVVRGAFSQRRKTLANSVSSALSIEKEKIYEAIKESDLLETVRPEELLMEDFVNVAEQLKKIIQIV